MLLRCRCSDCGITKDIEVDDEKYIQWKSRKIVIQEAFPHLGADDRELMMSGICGKCYDKLIWSDIQGYLWMIFCERYAKNQNDKEGILNAWKEFLEGEDMEDCPFDFDELYAEYVGVYNGLSEGEE